MSLDIICLFKEVLEKELTKKPESMVLPEKSLHKLLAPSRQSGKDGDVTRRGIFGYPSRPLYKDLGEKFKIWMETGKCPVEELMNFDLLDEKDYVNERLEKMRQITPILEKLRSLHDLLSRDEICFYMREIIKILGKRGLLDLLGMRKTVGSRNKWPPDRLVLVETFCKKNNPDSNSGLTVGGRALTKHSHRDHSSSWWGVCTGSEQVKNDHAFKKMTEIMDSAAWMNIHELPGELPAIEIRQKNGYGVRWTCDGTEFRGFVEPQMVDGHVVGWIH